MNLITIRSAVHGTYQCAADSLDMMITRYPWPLADLVEEIAKRQGSATYNWQCSTKVEAWMILAELDGLATN